MNPVPLDLTDRRPRSFGRIAILGVIVSFASMGGAAGQICEDRDEDGYFSVAGCGTDRDCNDDDAAIRPGATELCDGQDGDCNGFVDDSLACNRVCEAPEKLLVETEVSQGPAADSEWGNPVWVGDGWVVAYQTRWQGDCTRFSLRWTRVATRRARGSRGPDRNTESCGTISGRA